MNKYIKPELNEIVIEIEDVIAASTTRNVNISHNEGLLNNPTDSWFN